MTIKYKSSLEGSEKQSYVINNKTVESDKIVRLVKTKVYSEKDKSNTVNTKEKVTKNIRRDEDDRNKTTLSEIKINTPSLEEDEDEMLLFVGKELQPKAKTTLRI